MISTPKQIDSTLLASRLDEILDQVEDVQMSITIEREGKPVARLTPVTEAPGVDSARFRSALAGLRMPDDQFADDLEQIQIEQNRPEAPRWPT